MQDSSVLDIHPVSNLYCIYISAENGAVPNAAVVANGDISNYNAVFCQKAVFSYFGAESP